VSEGRSQRFDAWRPALLALATLALYAPVAGHSFLNTDDPQYVTENARVLEGLSWANARWALTTLEFASWSPLTWLSHLVDTDLFGPRAGARLVENALWHALASAALYAALARATGRRGRSFVAAGLFALHPLHVESVAWVSSRKDVLSGLFWMLAMGAHVRWAQERRRSSYAALGLYTLLGLAAKPVVATLPLVLLLLDLWPLERLRSTPKEERVRAIRRLVVEKLPLFALATATLGLAWQAQRRAGAMVDLELVPPALRLANALRSCVLYLIHALWPANLAAFYPYPADLLSTASSRIAIAGCAVALTALSAGALAARRPRPWLAIGWLWYLVVLTPMVGLVQLGRQAMADRYSYLPLVGIFVAVAWEAADAGSRLRAPRWLIASGSALVLAAFAAVSWHQIRFWRDSVTLFEHAVAVTGPNAIAHNNLGAGLAATGRIDAARAEFETAVAIDPSYARARENLALSLQALGRRDEAASQFRANLAIDPERAPSHFGLAHLMVEEGELEAAVEEYRRGLASEPTHAAARSNLGFALLQLGRPGEAAAELAEAVREDPKRLETRIQLADALLASDRAEEALAQIREAVALAPGRADLRSRLAIVLARLGRNPEAREEMERAPSPRPDR